MTRGLSKKKDVRMIFSGLLTVVLTLVIFFILGKDSYAIWPESLF